jgi:ferrochelatase
MEYGELARENGVPAYIRVPTVGTAPEFINGLAQLVGKAMDRGDAVMSEQGKRICPAGCGDCLLAASPAA